MCPFDGGGRKVLLYFLSIAMNLQEWINYGQDLAEKHREILHQDATGKRAFAVVDVEEAFGDVKGYDNDVLVRWMIPTYQLNDPGGNPQKTYEAGFIILVKHSRGITTSYLDAIRKAERISDEIIARMRHDSLMDESLFASDGDNVGELSVTGVPIKGGADMSYSGWIVTLSINTYFNTCAGDKDVNGLTQWTDL